MKPRCKVFSTFLTLQVGSRQHWARRRRTIWRSVWEGEMQCRMFNDLCLYVAKYESNDIVRLTKVLICLFWTLCGMSLSAGFLASSTLQLLDQCIINCHENCHGLKVRPPKKRLVQRPLHRTRNYKRENRRVFYTELELSQRNIGSASKVGKGLDT